MRRHAVRRGRSHTSNSGSDLNDSNSTTVPPKVQRVSGSLHVGSGCCVTNKPDKLSQDTSSSVQMVCLFFCVKSLNKIVFLIIPLILNDTSVTAKNFFIKKYIKFMFSITQNSFPLKIKAV